MHFQYLMENLLIIHMIFFFSNFILLQIESENKVVPIYSVDAEFARPLWIFGMNSYEFLQSPKQKKLIVCSYR